MSTSTCFLGVSRGSVGITSMAADMHGNVYYTRKTDCCVHKASCAPAAGGGGYTMTALAGSPQEPGNADGPGPAARFTDVRDVKLDPHHAGSLLVAEGDVVRLRRVACEDGATTTLALTGLPDDTKELLTLIISWTASGGTAVHALAAAGNDEDDDGRVLLRLDFPTALEARATVVVQLNVDEWVSCLDLQGRAVMVQEEFTELLRREAAGHWEALAGSEQTEGYRDGPGAQALFQLTRPDFAVAGDGTVLVTDGGNFAIRAVSAEGMVSTLAGGQGGHLQDGPPLQARFCNPECLALALQGLVVSDRVLLAPQGGDEPACATYMDVLRVVPTSLPLPPWLAPPPPAPPPPPPPHPSAVLNGELLRSGLLADVVIRVTGGHQQQQQQQEGQLPADAAAAGVSGATGGSGCGGEAVDIRCHRAVLAAASPYFRARFAGPLAQHLAPPPLSRQRRQQQQQQQQGAAVTADAAAAVGGAAPAADAMALVEVPDACAEAVHAVLRHVYEGDLGGVTGATAQDMLHLAQLWGLDGLLEAVQAHVTQHLLLPANAAQWLVCAHRRQYGVVRRAALRAVVEHYAQVYADPEQMGLLEGHPKLLAEAMRMACEAE